MNDKKPEPSRLILPAGVQHPDAKPPEVFGVITPAVGRWVATVKLPDVALGGGAKMTNFEDHLEVQAWAQIRRGEGSTILAEQLTVPGGVQVNLTLACPVLPLEPMVFYKNSVVSLRSVLEATGGELVGIERLDARPATEAL